jgi:hypothetical protein
MFYEYARRTDVRSVDRIPPMITSTQINAPCGWGSSLPSPVGESDPTHPKKCLSILGVFTDACDNQPTAQVLNYWVYDASWNLKFTSTPAEASCIRAMPDALDTLIGTRYYVLQWRAIDAWNNVSPLRYTRFRVQAAAPTSTCAAPRTVEVLADEPW